jgi:diaminopimelate decarboxylase
MDQFNYRNHILFVEDLPLSQLAAEYETPCYIYSKKAIEQNWLQYTQSFANTSRQHRIFYAVKANSSLAILNILSKLGAGFDAVSGGEIDRVLAAGGKADDIVFSGVGKSSAEIAKAIDLGIHSLNIESTAELQRAQEIAKAKNKSINIAIRVNPGVSANSHPYISTGSKENKFGIEYDQALQIFSLAATLPNLKIKGITCHIGSQITSMQPFEEAIEQVLNMIDLLTKQNIKLEFVNLGGGLGVCYKNETPPTPAVYVKTILDKLQNCPLELHLEPGRSIIADAGVLLTKVEYLKTTGANNFAIIDAAMNDLLRPALYESYHQILPVQESSTAAITKYNIVGPVCESGDFLGKERLLNIAAGDLLTIKTCGAYGFSMSSNYNTRPRCAEVMVDGAKAYLIRRRETVQQLFANEMVINAE